jgi:hypothetical protein
VALVDRFVDRRRFDEASFVGTTNSLAATDEPGEPRHADKAGGKSLWLTWHAPATGVATFRTVGSSFDTLLAVYTGTVLNQLAEVASDEDRGGFLTSELQFNAVAGTDYQVALAGFAGAAGTVVLGWNLDATAPRLPTFTEQPADVLARAGQRVTFRAAAGPAGVAYRWLANGQPLAGANTATLVLDGANPSQAGLYRVRVTAPGGGFVESRDALLEVTAESGMELGGLSAEKLADLFAEAPAAADSVPVAPPPGPGLISWSQGTRFLNLANSLSEPGDPMPCDVIATPSRWLRFRTGTAGTFISVSTTNAAFDSVLAVYTNRFAPALVACNDDLGTGSRNSQVFFEAVAGVDYLVMVAAKGGGGGVSGVAWLATAGDGSTEPLGLKGPSLVDGHFTYQRVVPQGLYQLDRGPALRSMAPLQRLRVRSGLLDIRDPDPATGSVQFYRFNLAQ